MIGRNMENKVNVLFIKIPKTGSTSIRKSLNLPPGHQTLAMFKEVGTTYDYSFTFVRNTYTRLVSWYRHEYNHNIEEFRQWVKAGCVVDWEDDWNASWQDNKPLNQMNYITDKSGNINIDFIGFFENINDDFLELCNELDINPPPKLAHIIPKPFLETREARVERTQFSYNAEMYYDMETKEIVDNLFKDEIEYFKFKFFEK